MSDTLAPVDPATGTGTAASDAAKATTTYIGFVDSPDLKDGYVKLGEVTVPAGRADKAKQHFLERLAELYPDATKFTVAVCPARGWQSETFELAPPAAPKFVSKG